MKKYLCVPYWLPLDLPVLANDLKATNSIAFGPTKQ